ncbi:unnamed protein product [Rhizophagus irregularis]|nr:unnamed protein product [Rhizophagus irregularis]
MTNVEYGGYENIKIIEIDRCSGCGQKFADEILSYCKPCYSSHFRNNFVHWKSGSLRIDKLIQDSQLNANHQYELIEWIEYSNLEIIKFVAYDGFGNVYEAIWKDGPIDSWNINKSGWNRNSNKKVAIKKLRNVTSVSSEYLNEVKNNLMLNYTARCNGIYGMTRDPDNEEYVIVTEFQNDEGERPPIPEHTPEPYAALMKHCWDPIPTNRPTTDELYGQIVKWEKVICKFEHSDSQVATKLKIKEAFNHEREEKWKAQLAKLATNSCPLKKSQNMLASKKLDCSKQLTEVKDVEMKTNDHIYCTRQYDFSLSLEGSNNNERV